MIGGGLCRAQLVRAPAIKTDRGGLSPTKNGGKRTHQARSCGREKRRREGDVATVNKPASSSLVRKNGSQGGGENRSSVNKHKNNKTGKPSRYN